MSFFKNGKENCRTRDTGSGNGSATNSNGNADGRPKGKFSWMQMVYLIIAMLAMGIASIYVTRIIDGDSDHFDWIMTIALMLIGVSNALQFFYSRRNDARRR